MAVLGGGESCLFLEDDGEALGGGEVAVAGDEGDGGAAVVEEFLGEFDAGALDFLADAASECFAEAALEGDAGKAGGADDGGDGDFLRAVFADEGEGAGKGGVVEVDDVGGFSGDDFGGVEEVPRGCFYF